MNIQEALREKGKEVEWLASEAEVTPDAIKKIIADRRRGSPKTLLAIAEALSPHVSFTDLLFRDLKPKPPKFRRNKHTRSAA